jgi:hypothetical protein
MIEKIYKIHFFPPFFAPLAASYANLSASSAYLKNSKNC